MGNAESMRKIANESKKDLPTIEFCVKICAMKETTLTISLPPPTQDALKRISEQNGTSKRWEARKLVIEGVKPKTKKA